MLPRRLDVFFFLFDFPARSPGVFDMPYGSDVVGQRVWVEWLDGKKKVSYGGVVESFNASTGEHTIFYDDDERVPTRIGEQEEAGLLSWRAPSTVAKRSAPAAKTSAAKTSAAKRPAPKRLERAKKADEEEEEEEEEAEEAEEEEAAAAAAEEEEGSEPAGGGRPSRRAAAAGRVAMRARPFLLATPPAFPSEKLLGTFP